MRVGAEGGERWESRGFSFPGSREKLPLVSEWAELGGGVCLRKSSGARGRTQTGAVGSPYPAVAPR